MSRYHIVKKEKPLESDYKLLIAGPSEKFSRRNLIKTGGGGDYRNNNVDTKTTQDTRTLSEQKQHEQNNNIGTRCAGAKTMLTQEQCCNKNIKGT